MTTLPNALAHISVGTNQFEAAVKFYDAVLATLSIKRVLDLSEHGAIAYGRVAPEFWVQKPYDGQTAQVANGVHIAFWAENAAQVDAFYQVALAQGAQSEGEPGGREHYGSDYYGCFVRDIDGHKIEAMTLIS